MSKSTFETFYIEITLKEQIKILLLNELKVSKQLFLSYKIYLTILGILTSSIYVYYYFNDYFNLFLSIIFYAIGIISICIYFFFIFLTPFFLKPKIYYNRDYRNVSFNQKELLRTSSLSCKNIIFTTLTSFKENNDSQLKKEKDSLVYLIYFKIMNYKLSSFEKEYILIVVSYLILLFIGTLFFIFEMVDVYRTILSENILFFYSMIIFLFYSWFVYKYIIFLSSYYKMGLKYSNKIKFYDKYFIFDFILNFEPIKSLKTYMSSNIFKQERNYFMYALLAGIFWIYVPLMYDKIYSVDVNVKSVDSKVIQKIK